eukprot:TRINITY_DN7280_c0_g1_i1.p1 TRINITY_DN7280_c0_g1~~TRINITY_DN7280_c0_g1_i1.p1  ORF type:complete len:185 (-),score=36.25 TRINITY_DN7280_c0_g1_i1:71-625(-)
MSRPPVIPPRRAGAPATAPAPSSTSPPAGGRGRGARPDQPHFTKPSRLIAAAKAGEDNLIQEYLTENKTLDVNKVDSLGQTSIHWACSSGYPTTVQLLLSFGGRIDIKDKAGETPLHKAAWRGSAECAKILIDRGADKDAKNNEGKTPLELTRVREVRRLLVPPNQLVDADIVEDDQDQPIESD